MSTTEKKWTYRNDQNGLPFKRCQLAIGALSGAHSCYEIARALINYKDVLRHQEIALALRNLASHPLDLDEYFWDTILPYAKAVVVEANRDSIVSMVTIMQHLSQRLVQDDELWTVAVRDKLMKDRLLRYVPIDMLPVLFYSLAHNQKGTPAAMNAIETLLLQNIEYYRQTKSRRLISLLKEGYDYAGRPVPPPLSEVIANKYIPPVPLPEL